MSQTHVDALVALLAGQALNRGGRDYFRNLVAQANIPELFKYQQQENWTGRADQDARTLISWAHELGVNPNDNRTTTLGAILKPELGGLGANQAMSVVTIMMAEHMILEADLLVELRERYVAKESPTNNDLNA
jgi:hypothetical protein